MLPAAALLLVFLTYPLGLGLWLGFTDAKIGRAGHWIGAENFLSLYEDSLSRLSLFNTLFYTIVASVVKFVLGLWLALLLNRHLPFKSFIRAVVLLPFIVPTALSAIAFWWLYDAQFSVVSWLLVKMGLIDRYIDFLGEPWMARLSTIAANIWRGVPFVAICLLAGLQTISPSLYEAAALDGATEWQKFRHGADARRAAQRHAPDGDALVPARDPRGQPRRGRGARHGDGAVPAGRDPLLLLRPAAPRLAAGRPRQMTRIAT